MATYGIDAGVETPVADAAQRPTLPGVSRALPSPEPGRWAAEAFVAEHLGHLVDRRGVDLPDSSSVYRGGQQAADDALARFDVAGYAARAADAYPLPRRSVSGLSPWIRHGLLSLPRLWEHVADGPPDDVRSFRGALLRQEYARHRYARHRTGLIEGAGRVAHPAPGSGADPSALRSSTGRGWDRRMGCVELPLDELEEDGWVVGPARRWLADLWVAGEHDDPGAGEAHFFRHLLDGSKAANGLGWQEADNRAVTRWEVEEHAPGLCASCELVAECPIERPRPAPSPPAATTGDTPAAAATDTTAASAARTTSASSPTENGAAVSADDRWRHDHDLPATTGPLLVRTHGADGSPSSPPEAVWLTAESLGDSDPALAANPDLPAVFVFDEPLLAELRLSSKRLVFLAETLGELAARRPVELHLGEPVEVLTGRRLAATFTPVPGWRRRSARLDLAEVHPWPWLRTPHDGDVTTFEAWRAGSS